MSEEDQEELKEVQKKYHNTKKNEFMKKIFFHVMYSIKDG